MNKNFTDKQISVIVPCYNVEKYIEQCLQSIMNQTIGIHNMKVILVDDASTDSTLSYLLKYEELFPQSIEIIALDKNCGQANARNIGMDEVKTEYFAFVDADDWLELDMYEKMLKPAHQDTYDWIQCGVCENIEGIPPHYEPRENALKSYYIRNAEERKAFLQDCNLKRIIGCSLFRTEWIREQKLKFKSFTKYEDNYWGELLKYAFQSYYSIPDCLYHYRVLEQSNSHARNDMKHFVRLEVELEKLNYFIERGWFQTYYEEMRKAFLEGFYINTLHIVCCQFDYMPLEQIRIMQSTVKEGFPDYLEYDKQKKWFINPIITVSFDFPADIWEQYRVAYYDWVSQGNETAIVKFYRELRYALGLTENI